MLHQAHGLHRRAADTLGSDPHFFVEAPLVELEERDRHDPRSLAILAVWPGLVVDAAAVIAPTVRTVRRMSALLAIGLLDHHFPLGNGSNAAGEADLRTTLDDDSTMHVKPPVPQIGSTSSDGCQYSSGRKMVVIPGSVMIHTFSPSSM